jgi:putative PEP-CTERM system histidine kinase
MALARLLDAMRSSHDFSTGGDRRRDGYRERWMAFTGRLTRSLSANEIGRELTEHLAVEFGATSAGVYLVDDREPAYRLTAQLGAARFARTIEETAPLASWLVLMRAPTHVPAQLLPSITIPALPTVLAVCLRWRATLLGFIVLGPSRRSADYDAGDLQFLTTLADQVAASIVATRMAEPAATPRALETLDRVSAAAIHDIKNSVSALSLLSRNAAANFSDPEFQRDAMATLSRTVERMRRLLFTLSSREPATPQAEAIDLHELIVEATTPLMANPRIRLVRRLGPVPGMYGNREALLRVIENLATNAAEAIADRGTVTVTLAQEQGHVVISVADTGCGITEEFRNRHLFSPFSTTKKDGWGIGLYQAKQAVESQHGEILVESTVGRGTTFSVRLPLQADLEHSSLETVR